MNNGIINIHGNEYETVASRVQKFRETYKNWCLETKIVVNTENNVVIEARISDETGRLVANGHAEEFRNSSHINKTSALENAETSAWGRALANLGLAGVHIASADEMKHAVKTQAKSHPASTSQKTNYGNSKKKITEKQDAWLNKILQSKIISTQEFLKDYNVDKTKDLTMDGFNEVIEKAKELPSKISAKKQSAIDSIKKEAKNLDQKSIPVGEYNPPNIEETEIGDLPF